MDNFSILAIIRAQMLGSPMTGTGELKRSGDQQEAEDLGAELTMAGRKGEANSLEEGEEEGGCEEGQECGGVGLVSIHRTSAIFSRFVGVVHRRRVRGFQDQQRERKRREPQMKATRSRELKEIIKVLMQRWLKLRWRMGGLTSCHIRF